MKVFYIDPQSYNNLSVYDYHLLTHVRGHEIVYYGNQLYQCEPIRGVKQKLVFCYSTKKHVWQKALSYFVSMFRILLDVMKERPDVVHVQWLRLWQIDYAFERLLNRMGIQLVFTAHNVLPHNDPKPQDKKRYAKYYQMADSIIVHSERTKREMVSDIGVEAGKIKVIHHGILENGVNQVDVLERCEVLSQTLGIKQGDIVFSCLGLQNTYKGIDLVVKVWNETIELKENPQLHLLFVGRNKDIDFSPLEGCGNAFVLDEMISDVDFDAYLQLSSVVLLPYKKASQSGVLFTALSRGIPVLVSDVGGLTEPLQYAHVGWDIGEPTAEKLQRTLLRLVQNKGEIDHVRQASEEFERIKQIYSWESIGEQTSKLYACVRMFDKSRSFSPQSVLMSL